MEKITIRGNGVPREVFSGFELSKKEKLNFNWMENIDDGQFFRYKGQVYSLSEIMAVHNPNPPKWMKKFDGYMSNSYFSGILVKFGSIDFPDNPEYIRVYNYYS